MKRFKVFVTKDFPRIYEESVFFKDGDINSAIAVIREGYGNDDPYVGDTYTPPEILKEGEWFWEFKDAKKDWNRRRKRLILELKNRVVMLQAKIEHQESHKSLKRSTVEENKLCQAFPDGKQAQLERYDAKDKAWERMRLEKEIARQEVALKTKKERLKQL